MIDPSSVRRILLAECEAHPSLEPVDLRKLMAQAVFGCDHLLGNRERFARELHAEWQTISPSSVEGALQVIDPDGRTARLHLAPCKARGIDVGDLSAVLAAQPLKRGRRRRWSAMWEAADALARSGQLPFSASRLAGAADESPGHHSGGYGPTAYRVVNDIRAGDVAAALRRWGIVS